MKLFAKIKDPHTTVDIPVKKIPFEFKIINDRLYIVKDNSDLNYQYNEVVSINGKPINEMLKNIRQYISYDNESWAKAESCHMLENLEFLRLVNPNTPITFDIKDRKTSNTIRLNAESIVATKKDDRLSTSYDEKTKTFYIKYGTCIDTKDFIEKTIIDLKKYNVQNVVVDLQNNIGGNSSYIEPLIRELQNYPNINAIVNDSTFSSGFIAMLKLKEIGATISGIEPGMATTHFGNCQKVTLPSGINVFVSSKEFFYYDEKMYGEISVKDMEGKTIKLQNNTLYGLTIKEQLGEMTKVSFGNKDYLFPTKLLIQRNPYQLDITYKINSIEDYRAIQENMEDKNKFDENKSLSELIEIAKNIIRKRLTELNSNPEIKQLITSKLDDIPVKVLKHDIFVEMSGVDPKKDIIPGAFYFNGNVYLCERDSFNYKDFHKLVHEMLHFLSDNSKTVGKTGLTQYYYNNNKLDAIGHVINEGATEYLTSLLLGDFFYGYSNDLNHIMQMILTLMNKSTDDFITMYFQKDFWLNEENNRLFSSENAGLLTKIVAEYDNRLPKYAKKEYDFDYIFSGILDTVNSKLKLNENFDLTKTYDLLRNIRNNHDWIEIKDETIQKYNETMSELNIKIQQNIQVESNDKIPSNEGIDMLSSEINNSTDSQIITLPNGKTISVSEYLKMNRISSIIPNDAVVILNNGKRISGAEFIQGAISRAGKFNTFQDLFNQYVSSVERQEKKDIPVTLTEAEDKKISSQQTNSVSEQTQTNNNAFQRATQTMSFVEEEQKQKPNAFQRASTILNQQNGEEYQKRVEQIRTTHEVLENQRLFQKNITDEDVSTTAKKNAFTWASEIEKRKFQQIKQENKEHLYNNPIGDTKTNQNTTQQKSSAKVLTLSNNNSRGRGFISIYVLISILFVMIFGTAFVAYYLINK